MATTASGRRRGRTEVVQVAGASYTVTVVPGSPTDEIVLAAADRALECWADFAFDRVPRPLVLVGSVAQTEGGGFRNGSAKLAYIDGLIEAHVPVPRSVLDLLRERSRISEVPAHPPSPLVITGCRPGETAFPTDRGRVVLPAWRLQGPDVVGAVWVLDPETAARAWRARPLTRFAVAPGDRTRSHGSRIEDDGITLHFQFTGAPPEYESYPRALVRESASAVAVVPVVEHIGPTRPRRLIGRQREVVVRLGSPLAGRVLVNLDGGPIPVTTCRRGASIES